MSKSRGNVVNPDDIVAEFGADTLRTYEMFIGAFDLSASWSQEGVKDAVVSSSVYGNCRTAW